MKFSRFVVAGAALAASGGLALTLAPATMALPVAEDATQMTTITMRVTLCEGCTIQGVNAKDYQGNEYTGPTATVTNGVATMVVPTAETVGMIFRISPVKDPGLNAQPLIAMSYDNAPANTTTTVVKAKKARFARPCWAGTNESAYTMSVRVRWTKRFTNAFENNVMTRAPIAWAAPSQPSLPPGLQVHFKKYPKTNGVLAVQDYIICKTS